ncbi:sigma-54-dependent Fis family transcriptional regulator [Cocleimonas flava]|uniref:Transcriptional regulator of acetoin/glycerol metabolism n=1 Tax=Cocleimonas flava TaxID=634765 RepID=A0A4R1EYI1_9GAMM|nr:sigma 54-interacting transcriptional regulator [Cocleimonas flava]TCJ83081.1 transcriptional regulator of acetoin/glycerol metabolism [Cocleimonas flava]
MKHIYNPNSSVNKLAIASSWQRCRNDYQLSQYTPRPIQRLQDTELTRRQDQLVDFLLGDTKEIQCLAELMQKSQKGLFVAGTDSTLLMGYQEHVSTAFLKPASISPGFCWSEPAASTNAVSLALQEKKSITVEGKSHYYKSFRQFSCTGTPLFDSQNELIGALAIAGRDDDQSQNYIFYQYILSLAAARIQARLFKKHYSDIDTMHLSFAGVGSSADESINALCAVNATGDIVGLTNYAAKLLGYKQHEELINQKVEDVFGLDVDKLASLAGTKINVDIDQGSTVIATPFLPNLNRSKVKASSVKTPKKKLLRDIVGKDKSMLATVDRAKELYKHGVPLLLQGETGCGKKTFAELLHDESSFLNVPFVSIDCTIVDVTKEGVDKFLSELDSLRSLNQTAKQEFAGTIYLKSIDSLPNNLQMSVVSLLKEIDVAVQNDDLESGNKLRVISSIHDEPNELVKQGKLSLELLHHTNGASIVLKPLRKRNDLKFLISQIAIELAKGPVDISDAAYSLLLDHQWLGNFWELRNVMRYSLLGGNGKTIHEVNLPENLRTQVTEKNTENPTPIKISSNSNLDENDPRHLRSTLNSTDWNVSKAARRLGISRATMYRKMKTYQLSRTN